METMMKRVRGRPRKYYSFDDSPEFFKVFLPFSNSQELKIPMSFVMEFGGIIHKKTTLKGRDGKLWDVDVEKTDAGVFMKNGWLNFVNHYSLSIGEFLVFRYTGNSTFVVKIFGINGSKTEALPTQSNIRDVIVEEESEEIEAKKFCTTPFSSKQSRGPKKSQKVSSQLVEQEIDEIEELVVSENPYFIAPVDYKQKYYLNIPREIFSVHKVKIKPEMVLRNEEEEEWPVNVYKCADGRVMFGGGWVQFWRENDVRSCDSCKFTFLKGGSSKVIEVQILRGHSRHPSGSRRSKRSIRGE